jgi:HAD superfamily hydrolase (TIGR01484 family)
MPPRPLQSLTSGQLKNIRLIATDMDGTLTKDGKFTPQLLATFAALTEMNITILIVTGRSAGWVSGLAEYLPIQGAIAENGGLFYRTNHPVEYLVEIADRRSHRQALQQMFQTLQQAFPKIQESSDNLFRITDWTFDVAGLDRNALKEMGDRCHTQGFGFTYSTVQCHIRLPQQDKAVGLMQVLKQFPDLSMDQVITVGDSPNDESLFERDRFPISVGVANVQHYLKDLNHQPSYMTDGFEADGFCELGELIRRSRA